MLTWPRWKDSRPRAAVAFAITVAPDGSRVGGASPEVATRA